jgi:hypothetical protein
MRRLKLNAKAGSLFLLVGWAICSAMPDTPSLLEEGPMHASRATYADAVVSMRDARSGIILYVESDGRRLVALNADGTVRWSSDVVRAIPYKVVGGAVLIRHLQLAGENVLVTCGKSDTVQISLQTGQAQYLGADKSQGSGR